MSGFTPTQRRRLAAKAATIPERLEAGLLADEPASDAPAVDDWAAMYGGAFDERLQLLETTRTECRRAAAVDQAAEVPEWITRLETVVTGVTARDLRVDGADTVDTYTVDDNDDRPHVDGPPRPFGSLTAAIAAEARDGLPTLSLSESAVDSFAAALQSRVERNSLQLLYEQFDRARRRHAPDARASVGGDSEPETAVYEKFLAYLLDDGLVELCLTYPVFGRLLSTQVRQWRSAVVTFAERLNDDRAALAEQFADRSALGRVTAVRPLTRDRHGDGRVTRRVEFKCGVTVVYKPRTVRPEAALAALTTDLAADGDLPRLRQPQCLVRDGYGWTSLLDTDPPTGETAARRYYRQFGARCCLARLTETTDCHTDNVVATDDGPALVDAETICHPYLDPNRRPYDWGFGRAVDETPLSTAMLPYQIRTEEGSLNRNPVGPSAAPTPDTEESRTETVVRAVATDAMCLETVTRDLDGVAADAPVVDGEPALPSEYVDAVVAGFERTHRAVRAQCLSGDTPLTDHLGGLPVRFVYRPTGSYRRILDRLREPATLADGARFGVVLDRLTVPAFDGTADRHPLSVLNAERTALKRLDHPRFTSRSDATVVEHDGVPLCDLADVSGLDRARARVTRGDDRRLAEEVAVVRAALGEDGRQPLGEHTTAHDPHDQTNETIPPSSGDADWTTPSTAAQASFERAVAAGETPAGRSYVWSRFDPTATRLPTVAGVGLGLERGRTGVAILGAALSALDGTGAYYSRTRSLLDPVLTATADALDDPATIGYGLVVAGSLLNDDRILSTGTVFARAADPGPSSVMDGGLAGTVAAATGVARATDDERVRSQVVAFGDRLLDRSEEWQCAPPTYDRGSGGVVYALAHAWAETGCERFREAAAETVASWEQPPDAPTQVGLDARLPGVTFDSPTSERRGDEYRGGTAGRITLQIAAGRETAAAETADRLLTRVVRDGRYTLPTDASGVVDPTLRDGYAGVGYALARCVSPTLPCLVLRG